MQPGINDHIRVPPFPNCSVSGSKICTYVVSIQFSQNIGKWMGDGSQWQSYSPYFFYSLWYINTYGAGFFLQQQFLWLLSIKHACSHSWFKKMSYCSFNTILLIDSVRGDKSMKYDYPMKKLDPLHNLLHHSQFLLPSNWHSLEY